MKEKIVALKPFNNKVYYKNEVFNEHSPSGSPYLISARKLLAKNNIQIDTIDVVRSQSDKEVYMDLPYPWELGYWIRILKNRKKNILFIIEPPIVNPFNYIKIFHLFFSKIYTWNDDVVDNIKYFKYYPPVSLTKVKTNQISFENKKLLIMMNRNWLPFLPFKLLSLSTKELYSERIKALNFFNKNFSSDFSLYGRGWNKPQKFSILQILFGYKKYKTYKGEFSSKDKYEILSKFKFCLCVENNEIAGNISEKIFDCFKARCIPIYLGAPNIEDLISNKCFIYYRKFKNYNELVKFLNAMNETIYQTYIKNIEEFLTSKEFMQKWSVNAFAKTFLKIVS